MEVNDWVLIVGICVVATGCFTVLAWSLMGYIRDFRITKLENAVDSIQMTEKSAKGVSARAEKAERMQTAMVEVAAIMKNPEIPDKQGAIMQLALKYPDIALDLVKKGL